MSVCLQQFKTPRVVKIIFEAISVSKKFADNVTVIPRMENISFDVTLGTIRNGKILWNTEEKCRELLGEIDSIAWYLK